MEKKVADSRRNTIFDLNIAQMVDEHPTEEYEVSTLRDEKMN